MAFGAEIRIADFNGTGGRVGTIGEQLFRRRRAFGARPAQRQAETAAQINGAANREGDGVERAFAAHLRRFHIGMFIARAAFQPHRPQIEFLQREQAELAGFVGRDIGFCAGSAEIAAEILDAGGALPAILVGLHQFQAGFPALVEEAGADFTGVFQLVVAIIGPAAAHANFLEGARQRHRAAHVHAGLAHVQADIFLAATARRAVGNAITIFQMAHGESKIGAVLADPAKAAADIPRPSGGVIDAAARLRRPGDVAAGFGGFPAQIVAEHKAAGAIIVGFKETAINVGNKAGAQRHIHGRGDIAFARRRGNAGADIDMGAAFRHFTRDAQIAHVHNTADGARTEQQRRRAAHDLDAIGQQRIGRNGMIDRGVGDIEAADAIGEHAHAFGIKAAQDGPRGVWTEEGGRHAGLARQGFADGGTQLQLQRIALQHGDGGGHQLAIPGIGRADDDFRVAAAVLFILRRSLFGQHWSGRQEQQGCKRQTRRHRISYGGLGTGTPI